MLLDACFVIGLRDCRKTFLLPRVASLLSWRLYIPEAAYNECTAKTADPDLCKMIADGFIIRCASQRSTLERIHDRYPSLGKGEVDAIAYAVSCSKANQSVIVITSDQRPIKVASELGIKTLTTLDFFKKVYELKIMSREEMYALIPLLKNHMWLSAKALDDFRNGIDSLHISESRKDSKPMPKKQTEN